MHIADGILNTEVLVTTAGVSLGMVGLSLKKSKGQLGERQIPMLGVVSSFIFAAQMLNFPIIGGTSGHLLGGMLASALLGPWNAVLALTTVLFVQAVFFSDGGITALGANVFNMAVIGVFTGYLVYQLTQKIFPGKTGKTIGLIAGSWLSVVAGAFAASVEIALSGLLSFKVAASALLFWHAFIGLGEAFITLIAVTYLEKVFGAGFFQGVKEAVVSEK
ncbi:energy-coupling factor ABC transporter permease [Carboxydothermus pertinax]|uniref:Cobalamin biosynthesis protein CbiM n=1 Tax=Carboxydothermus pertinax TaxID=870242 RepID=A0A1L8CXH8_9THEO|nr:energy-coupling factor ABC transporter permease [Carboxydothermus pertinax]GAV23574.1 cobalamin biosynthesis protein CbiM [Carboxydothermus pertinax]